MKCSVKIGKEHCPRVALYVIANTTRGYCGKHKPEAEADAKIQGQKSNRPKEAA